jgi:hypothetical protein
LPNIESKLSKFEINSNYGNTAGKDDAIKKTSRGGFYKAIYALRLKFALCAHLISLI